MKRVVMKTLVCFLAIASLTLFTLDQSMARAQNLTLPEEASDTRTIVNEKDHTIILLNTTTNETISTTTFIGNATTSGNLTGNATKGGI